MAIPKSEKERLGLIVSHSIERAGIASLEKIESERIKQYVLKYKGIGFNRSETHKQLICGAIVCHVTIGNLPGTVRECEAARRFIQAHEARFGRDALVFVSTDLFWACHGDNLPFRLFSLLCAVNSVIGFKKAPVLVRREMLRARQLGFKSPGVMKAALQPDQKPLSIQQLRDSLDALESRDLIRHWQASPRNVYFSTLLTAEELRGMVKTIVEKKTKVQERRELDRQAVRTTTEPQRNHLKMKMPGTEPLKREEPLKNREPEQNHSGTTTGTITGTTKISALKEEPLKKSSEINAVCTSLAPLAVAQTFKKPSIEEAENFGKTFHKEKGAEIGAEWF